MNCRGFVLGVVCFLFLFADANAAPAQWAFRVSFSAKNGYTITSPLTFLSQRSIDRRSNQGISIDSTDLPVSPAYIDSVLTLTNGVLHVTSRWMNDCVVLLTDSSKILMLQGKPYITSIQHIAYYGSGLHNKAPGTGKYATGSGLLAKGTGTQPYYNNTWGQTHMVNGDCLHDQGYKGQGKLIAVLDQGFLDADTHPALDSMRNSGRLLGVHDFVQNGSNIYRASSHGMNAASTIAGFIPNTYVGTAPLASFLLYLTEDIYSEQPIEMDNMIAGAELADSMGTDVITTSLGYNWFTDFPSASLTLSDIDGVSTFAAKGANMATKKGMLFVASAGNEGGNSWNKILTPGDADSALTIGSVTPARSPAGTSGFGPNAAGRVKPDVCAQGEPASVCNGSGYSDLSGTSFSTPQVAGWAACLWQSKGNASPYEVREAIIKSADRFNNPDTHLGYGIPEFCTAKNILLNVENPTVVVLGPWAKAYPTFFRDEANINILINSPSNQQVSVAVTDMSGKMLASFQKNVTKGVQLQFSWTAPATIPCGIYVLKVDSETGHYETKLLKY